MSSHDVLNRTVQSLPIQSRPVRVSGGSLTVKSCYLMTISGITTSHRSLLIRSWY